MKEGSKKNGQKVHFKENNIELSNCYYKNEYDLYKDDKEIEKSPINNNDSYTVKFSDINYVLYYLNNYDSNNIYWFALNQELITFGSSNEDIIIPNFEGKI